VEARWGKCLGRYELVAELGRGAMGVVYKARDPRIDRFVAVKTVSLLGASPEEALEYRDRFFQEAQAVGRLVHPGIVTVFDAGEEPETKTPYIVMEYIDGVALSTLLSNNAGKLPLDRALQLTEELAEALDCAHGQGVVHRDIKPANILVTNAGHAKITDFGIAKLNLAHLTLPGHVLGTPAYMSPEQLNGEALDGRSDLFSLGVILYSMVSGYRPFQGDSVTTVCFKLANHDPLPPSALDPELPHGVDAIILRAMAKDPAQRYQRGLEFALDVRELKDRLSANKRSAGAEGTSSTEVKQNRTGSRGNSNSGQQPAPAGSALFWQKFGEFSQTIGGAKRGRLAAAMMVAIATMGFAYSWHQQIYKPPRPRTTIAKSAALTVKNSASKAVAKPVETAPTLIASETPSPLPVAAPNTHTSPPRAVSRKARSSRPEAAPPNTRSAVPEAVTSSGSDATQNEGEARPLASAASTLVIGIDYPFTDGNVSISSDTRVLYSHPLKGETTKRLGLFQKVQGHDSGSVHLPTGEHQLRVRVQSKADGYDQLKTVSLDMARGETRTLDITFHGRQKLMRLDVR
jgi:serine/threonine protein kinase